MKKIYFVLASVLMTSATFAQTWSLDKAHSNLGFSITHLSISEVEGSFKTIDSKLTTSKDDFSDASVEFTADVASVFTDNDNRDKHLQSPDFFDAAKYPTVTFKSKSFTKVDGKNYKVTGDLTMHGVTKTVTLDVILKGTAQHPQSKKTIAGFKITGNLKRTDFGIATGTPEAMLSDEIALRANTEFVKG